MDDHYGYTFRDDKTLCVCGEVIAEGEAGPGVYQKWLQHRTDEGCSN